MVILLAGAHSDVLGRVQKLGWKVRSGRRISRERGMVAIARLGETDASVIAKALAANVPLILLYPKKAKSSLPELAQQGVRHFLKEPFEDWELQAHLIAAVGMGATAETSSPRDSLTGLAQAPALRRWAAAAMERDETTLLLINISRFDTINASLGRDAGDAALRAIARRIEPLVSESGAMDHLVARLPGAEFAIGLSGQIGADRLHLLAEAIFETVSRPLPTREGPLRLGCRVAVVERTPTDRTPSHLMRRASEALGEIRDGAADPVRLLLREDAETRALSKSLHADLRSALTNDEIEIVFQPQVSVATGRIEGVEALARWKHPVRGDIGASLLFAVAEQSGYLVELSSHIQRQALRRAAAWPGALSHLRLSVNVTGADLGRPRFLRAFQSLVDESAFPRGRLTVEVTESSVMRNLDAAAKSLGQVRASGCRVAIDDFGTGYSSLAWLKALPADYLKLDQGLSGDVLGGERDTVVLRGVIGMARSLGLTVIAEGVETEAQLALLAREGCGLYQGFIHSRPVDEAALLKLVSG